MKRSSFFDAAKTVTTSFGAMAAALAYTPVLPPADVKLPPALSPEASLAAIRVPQDLRIELVAAEPAVADPIDVAWGPDGRMWVVEMADYPAGVPGSEKGAGRIRILESTRGDGRYDKSTLFAEGLRFPTSVSVWRDGVLVIAAPDILLLRDSDGDGRADRREVLFSDIGVGNEQHLANGLQWGLDGWLTLAHGDTRGKITSTKTGRTLEMGRDVRIQPDTGEAELLIGRSQYGRNRDDWGNWFGGNNSNPVWHFALEDRYLARNPHFTPPNGVVPVIAGAGSARVFPRSTTLARFNDPKGQNHFTSACGVMVYRDDFLGAMYRDNVFVCEPVHNLVHRAIVRPSGATFAGARAPEEAASEFLASTDNWSRFTSVRLGPDGALYVVDMYRLVIEHPEWIPPEWLKQLGDVRAGADKGRIYRVTPRGQAPRAVPRLDRASTGELVAALESGNGTLRDLAQQQLVWRSDKAAVPALERLVAESARPAIRAQALWTIETLGALTAESVRRPLRDPHAGVRRQAVRLAEKFREPSHGLLPPVLALANDPDAAVRQQVAYSLGEWTEPAAGAALARLARSEEDRFVTAAALSSARRHVGALVAGVEPGTRIPRTLIDLAVAGDDATALNRVLGLVAASPSFAPLVELLEAWRRRGSLPDGAEPRAVDAVMQRVAGARAIAADDAAPSPERIAAAAVLGRTIAGREEDVKTLLRLLEPRSAPEVQVGALEALRGAESVAVARGIVAAWPGLGAKARPMAFQLLVGRTGWAEVWLAALESDAALRAQLTATQIAALRKHADKTVAQRAARVFSGSGEADRAAVVERYVAAGATLTGDRAKGSDVFARACSACHRFGATSGGAIGPDLASVHDRSAGYLITHILDPNRAIEGRYLLYTATTADGRTLAGMLTAESGDAVTLVGLDGAEQLLRRSELKTLTSSGRSLMPDGLESAIDPQAMADLIAFIAGAGPK